MSEEKGKKTGDMNFLHVVIAFLVTIIVVLATALFLVKKEGQKMAPHGPNPEPNSRLVYPRSAQILAA